MTLSTGDITSLLTSMIIGSVGAALHAVANVVNDPLAANSYIGLLSTPIGIAGLFLENGIHAAADLASSAVGLTSSVIIGIDGQMRNALAGVNTLLEASRTLTDTALIDGTLTAVQGIVSAPVTAALAGVDGLTATIARAATTTLARLDDGASTAVTTWLGNSVSPGALQNALATIGSAPLSPAAYTHALSTLVGAGATAVDVAMNTARGFASLPVRVAADLTGTTAAVM